MPILTDDAERDKLDKAQQAFRFQVTLITTRMLSGELGAQEWRVLFELEVRYLQIIAAILAAGSWQALTPELQRIVQDATNDQLGYFRRWAASAQLPTPQRSDAQILARAQLYAGAGDEVYARVRTAALGMPDLPVYPGQRSECMVSCKCHWLIEQLEGDGNWDCRWLVDVAAEHCPQCVRRAEVFAPLRIRGSLIMPYNSAGIFV